MMTPWQGDRPTERRCLVIDCHADSRTRVARALERYAFGRVATAADAYRAFRLTQARADWELVVINLDAPALNGFELYSRLREATGRELAVVFLTAHPAGRAVRVVDGRPAVRLCRWSGEREFAEEVREAVAWAAARSLSAGPAARAGHPLQPAPV